MRIVILLLLLSPSRLNPNFLPFLVVWNVGQGQWTTYVTPQYCMHIDAGGEIYPKPVEKWCKQKVNYVQISHWDKDHYNFLYKLKRFKSLIEEVHPPLRVLYFTKRFKDKNSNSTIHYLNGILFTGDSTVRAEKKWAHLIQNPRIIILPHHGSKTSSSKYLLSHLHSIKMGIVSARRARYNHPHPKIMDRYKEYKIPLLLTEVWGHIMIVQ